VVRTLERVPGNSLGVVLFTAVRGATVVWAWAETDHEPATTRSRLAAATMRGI
jgi:hypothetical protein